MEKLGIASGSLFVASSVKDDEAKLIADKYAQQLKVEYPDLTVAIDIIRDGQEITTVELE